MKSRQNWPMETIKPPKLHTGDVVGICSPSGTMAHKRDLLERAKRNFEKATGFSLVLAPNVYSRHYYSAGTAEERLADFHALIEDESVKAIIFSGGGDTAIDLVTGLNYDLIARHPKIISGISDATTLLSSITAKTGLVTFLGLEFSDYADHKMLYGVDSLKKAWFSGTIGEVRKNPAWKELHGTYTTYTGWQTIRPGQAKGRLVGGNLQSFLQLVGTEYELSFPQHILFFEAYMLPKKQIHKALMQLKMRGVFEGTSGLIMGYCLNSDDPAVVGNEQPLSETVLEVVEECDFPIMQIGEIGHWVENCLQPIGALASMDAGNLRFGILEPVVLL